MVLYEIFKLQREYIVLCFDHAKMDYVIIPEIEVCVKTRWQIIYLIQFVINPLLIQEGVIGINQPGSSAQAPGAVHPGRSGKSCCGHCCDW